MLTIPCQCGEVYHAEEQHVGRAIKCWKCGQILRVGAQAPTPHKPSFIEEPKKEPRTMPPRSHSQWWWVAGLVLAFAVVAVPLVVTFIARENDQPQKPTFIPVPQKPTDGVSKPVLKFSPSRVSVPKAPINRLSTGTNMSEPLGASGHGELTINNGTSYDAAVTLLDTDTNTALRSVYVRAREMTTLSNIAPSQCRLFFALGTNWDERMEEFQEDASFSVVEDLLRISETEKWAQTFSVTLHPVPEGRARTKRLSKEEFLKQLGRSQNR